MVRPLTSCIMNKLIKPAQFAEESLIKAIVNEERKAGDKLPPERELAQMLGITRPTLREALQRLARDGWISIKHGKASTVNDYKSTGGLGVLKSLIKVNKKIPANLINDWLEFRLLIFPALAEKAVANNSNKILSFLKEMPDLKDNAKHYAQFDWQLQMLIIQLADNRIVQMLYNDLSEIYTTESMKYFENEKSKLASLEYYKQLQTAIKNKQNIVQTVQSAMIKSQELWKELFN